MVFTHFLGVARIVADSKYFLDTGKTRFPVGCGLFHGLKELRKHNWDFLPFDVSHLDFVLLTHWNFRSRRLFAEAFISRI